MPCECVNSIIELLNERLYPLDYQRWQADELLDEVFRLLREDFDCNVKSSTQ